MEKNCDFDIEPERKEMRGSKFDLFFRLCM